MKDVKISDLASELNISITELIKNFSYFGILKTEKDIVSQQERELVLEKIKKKRKHVKVLTLQRKVKSTLKVIGSSGKNKTVSIETRKRKTYLKIKNKKIFAKNNTNNIQNSSKLKINTQNNLKNIKNNIKKNKIIKNNKLLKNNNNNNSLNNKSINNSILNKKIDSVKKNNKKINKKTIFSKNKNKEIFNFESFKNIPIHENKKKISINKLNFKDKTDINIPFKEKNKKQDKKINIKSYKNKNFNNNSLNNQKKYIVFDINKNKNNQKNYINRKKNTKNIHMTQKNKIQSKNMYSIQQNFNKPVQSINRDIIIGNSITVSDLANKMAVKSNELIKKLLNLGVSATINQVIDQETAQIVSEEMGHKVTLYNKNHLENDLMKNRFLGDKKLEKRSPIVTIMGHVDHGKTSLLDFIRSTKIASGESGGITQHIGAYHIKKDGKKITFLDTPGHAAFTSMRSRGAKITDIVILVVAADDGVKPQTIEAIQHAKAAKVPIIIAINKIDKINIDIEKIKNSLINYGIISEELGGENIFVPISAKTGKGIDKLLDIILLQSEILELKSVFSGMAKGVVIESYLDKGKGFVATVLIQEGMIKKGDIVLSGCVYGKIRSIRTEKGKMIQKSGPSIPIEILGLSGLPIVGSEITVVHNEKKAREVALYRIQNMRDKKFYKEKKINLDNLFHNMKKSLNSELNIVLKTDVQGTLEAIIESLISLSTKEIKINIIGSGVGEITETDAYLAIASNTILIGFNVKANYLAKKIIKSENLDLRYYSVIYTLLNEIKLAMKGMLSPEYKKEIIGIAEVRNVFKSPKFDVIAGCMVTEGVIKRNKSVRVLRNEIIIYEGELESLRRFKEDVSEIRSNMECGIGIKNYQDVCIGDKIEVFETQEIKQT
ncbi:translation initiation factor IF-2 [Buchnera aphidicola (Kurisakia onigurumii)]|uniref:translation initiation factor IF-2 n=1 Tax=Buchnera aphidicola TaxID=9 RepID=UPI0031B6DC27